MIPGESAHYYRDDVAHHSELKPPTVPINCRPPFRDGSTRLVSEIARSLLALNVASFWQGGGDAGREGCDAPCARTVIERAHVQTTPPNIDPQPAPLGRGSHALCRER